MIGLGRGLEGDGVVQSWFCGPVKVNDSRVRVRKCHKVSKFGRDASESGLGRDASERVDLNQKGSSQEGFI